MHLLSLLPISLLSFLATAQGYGQCSRPITRREWRTLSSGEQQDYIEAVQCLMEKPPRSSIPAAISRYDDFVGTHIVQADETHFVGIFYPFHRLLVASFEQTLRRDCGYAGAQPYWDWTLDLDDLEGSPIFDPDTGFGGNGDWVDGTLDNPEWGVPVVAHQDFDDRSGGGCIPNGPFQGIVTSMGPNRNIERQRARCIRRDFAPETFRDRCNVEESMDQDFFVGFHRASESMAHASGHYGIGGLYGAMTDKWASPADPIFWLHHSNVDRLWWSWQMRDIQNRLTDISGPLVAHDWTNWKGGNISLEYRVKLSAIGDEAPIFDLMDIQGSYLCYDFDELYE
ncbi:hypothetical protein MGG_05914 [Pyricularia oryzae 70-15]|uniref:Tyrosinase copper-binding domain-containing protein n=1 Tax=Pyricularia oryzae (strain 70-15 / ATCC MYA-4617 / FGSC 8958) TaxID=242507 RepID=G4N413_PYRO7|nr:uncharacterized protein MGG_05914 [Pyricularia oryzae 70-15]EHA51935.1 hypothetical protein MGG_05914 [Pyricularia oryzae 70-15]KAI7910885.1 hypothetical protein M9X92_010837 [Pyricularia oryzae]